MKTIFIAFALFFSLSASALECQTPEAVYKQVRKVIRNPQLIWEGYAKDGSGEEDNSIKGMPAYYQIFRGRGEQWIMAKQLITFLREGAFVENKLACSSIFLGGEGFTIMDKKNIENFPEFSTEVKLINNCPTLSNFSAWVGSMYNEHPLMLLTAADGAQVVFYGGNKSWTMAISKERFFGKKKENPTIGSYYDRCYTIIAAGGKQWFLHHDNARSDEFL